MESLERRSFRYPSSVRYAIAVVCVSVGLLARNALTPAIGPTALPFIFCFPAVVAAAWLGGLGPGLLAIILSSLAADWFFFVPVHAFNVTTTYDQMALAGFLLSSLIIVAAVEAMHRARSRLVRIESEAVKARDLLATTVASIGDAIIVTDASGNITFLNPEAERLTGWKNGDAKGQPLPDVFKIINEQTRRVAENPVDKVISTGKVTGLANHTLLVSKSGTETPIDDSAAPIQEPGAPLAGVVLVFRDVTNQRQAFEANARLAAIVKHSGDVILTKNLDGIIQSWNASAERLFGYKAQEIVGKHVTILFPPDRLNEEDYILDRLRHGEPVEHLATIRVAKDGKKIPVSVSVSPLKDAEGNLIGASKILRDISELVAAREALTLEKDLLATTLASIGDGVIVTDKEGKVTYLNAEAERLTKWSDADANGQPLTTIFRIVNEYTRQPVENPVEKVFRLGVVVGLANHTILISRDGTEIPIGDSAAPIRQQGGELHGVVLVFHDATEQRQAFEANAKLAAIVEHSGDAIFTKNLEGFIQSWNASAERLFGYKAQEIIGKHVTILFPPDRLNEEDYIFDRLRHGEPVGHLVTVRVAKDGKKIPVSISVSPLKDAEGNLIGASKILRDISELVAAREALTLEKELLATTLASIGDGVIVTDKEGKVTYLNAEAERLTKWPNADAAGQPLTTIFCIINENTRLPVENPVEKVFRLGVIVGLANHTILISRDGTEIPIDDSAAPIRQEGGELHGVVLVFRDFTEQKKAQEAIRAKGEELEKLVQQRTARLNEIVGDLEAFSYSIVHDMRAPLRAMQSFAQLLEEECSPMSETAHDFARRIQVAANRMDKLIQDGLNYSRMMREDLPAEAIDVAFLVKGIIDTYPAFQPPNAEIQVIGGFPLVKGNEAALTQCVSNLMGNAVKFVPPGAIPRVQVWAEACENRVRIFFKDNGIGISKGAHDRIFLIFQRLDARYEGTGIGLAIVKKAAERMGGEVGVESEPGKGSTFWLDLPIASEGKEK